MREIVDTDEDVRIPEMRQIMITTDLDFRRLQVLRLVGQRLAVEVLRDGSCDPDPSRVLDPDSGPLKKMTVGLGRVKISIRWV